MSALIPSFSHRLSILEGENFTLSDLTDSILLMCERSAAIINIVVMQIEGENNGPTTSAALMAAVKEIHDIEATTTAFHEMNKPESAA